jgi:precorrin-6A/cobalt-precorrin-6A reductase
MKRILLLGGIGEAAQLAHWLSAKHRVTYSLAGRASRSPDVPCTVRVGGFGGVQGLVDFLVGGDVDLIIDATHPYAAQISHHACLAAVQCSIPLWTYRRPAWHPSPQDDWRFVQNWSLLMNALQGFHRPFFSIGLAPLAHAETIPTQQQWLVRCLATQPPAAPRLTVLQSRGPFSLEAELALLQSQQIDVVVAKNSGGSAVAAKLEAARRLSLPVLMLARPILLDGDRTFNDSQALANAMGCDPLAFPLSKVQ